jgi:hypothetical protein
MLLALVLSDAALNASEASEFRLLVEPLPSKDGQPRRWTSGVNGWEIEKECPAFFQREIEGFGIVRIGPRCEDDQIPYAL